MGVRSPDAPEHLTRPTKKRVPRETTCRVQVGEGKKSELRQGTVAIGDEELHFHTGRTGRHGKDFAVHVRFDEITSLVADGPAGTLTVISTEQPRLILHLGRHASDWKEMIEDRPSIADDLGIKPTSRVAVVGLDDDTLLAELEARVPGCTTAAAGTPEVRWTSCSSAASTHRADLARLASLAAQVRQPGGIVFIVLAPKVRGLDVATPARTVGLVAGEPVMLSRDQEALRLIRV